MMPLNEDEAAEAQAEAIQKRVREYWAAVEARELAHILSQPEGRAVFWSLLSECGVYAVSYTGDMASTSFKEGRRSIGISILEKVLTGNENLYTLMRTEASNRAKERQGMLEHG